MLIVYLDQFKHETANEGRKTFKQSYKDYLVGQDDQNENEKLAMATL